VLSLLGLGLLGIFWSGFWVLLGVEALLYVSVLAAAGFRSAWKRREWYLVFGLPLAVSIMHFAWGSGFLWSMIKGLFTFEKAEKK
jgi:bacteriorhodopsin